MERSDQPRDRIPESPRAAVPLWIAFLLPPLMGLFHLLISYPLDHTACDTGTKLQLHIFGAIALGVDLFAGWLARREWVRFGSENPGQLPGPMGSRRLMALIGMLGAVLFGLIILAQWFPNLVLSPCIRT